MANFSIVGGSFTAATLRFPGLATTSPVFVSPNTLTWTDGTVTLTLQGHGFSLGPDGRGGLIIASGRITGLVETSPTQSLTVSSLDISARSFGRDLQAGHWGALATLLTSQGDEIIGGAKRDVIAGGALGDILYGLGAADRIDGGAGDDTIVGGTGHDTLIGGQGSDQFIFMERPGALNSDRITDFAPGGDRIELESTSFAHLGAAGPLETRFFHLGASAQTADQHILYDATTGDLSYDSDGSGAAAAVLIAHLDGAPALTASDVWVF